MIKTTNPSPLRFLLFRSLAGSLLLLLMAVGQNPHAQTNRPTPSRHHIATVRASDSSEGSRVTLSTDLSLDDYEAYRRGDRFYVRIPAADIPRADTLRGQGFADVRVQRSGDSTIISFRLQPGGSAHVEQRGNKLDIVFTIPNRGQMAANTGSLTSSSASPKKSTIPKTAANNVTRGSTKSANKNAESSRGSNSTRGNSNSVKGSPNSTAANNLSRPGSSSNSNTAATLSKPNSAVTTASPGAKPNESANGSNALSSKPGATPEASPAASPIAKPSVTPAAKSSVTPVSSPLRQTTPAAANSESPSSGMAAIKERLRYWILLAQLNPVPVAIGLGILVLLIALLLFQRRRARGTKGSRREPVTQSTPAAEVASTAKATEAKAEAPTVPAVPAAVLAGTVAAAAAKEAKPQPVPVSPAPAEPASDSRRQLVARVADEVKNATSGGKYEENIIGSNDRDTRQLVGAELLAALVGRHPERRERARELFMKHGYFEDATRDLRVADSPNERAAAARRLSFVHDREATPHLVGALQDSSPDVRRAAVEALIDVRDPEAIAPLNSLLQTENDRKVPRTLIKHAIDVCATAPPSSTELLSSVPTAAPPSSVPESEREVIEL